jgi:signal transduction histidine kinase/ligand-binding sensor domain-containing protein
MIINHPVSFSFHFRKALSINSLWLIVLMMSMSLNLYAWQKNYQPFEFYGKNDGLSQASINAIHQDKYGYLWFGSQDGLNRFDGVKFKVFKNDVSNPNSISDNYITALIEDQHRNLWIGTRSGGLNKYDIDKDEFISYKHEEGNSNSLIDNRILALTKTSDGTIWIGTSKGLCRFEPDPGTFEYFKNDPLDSESISSNQVNSLFVDTNDDLWVGTSTGLNQYDAESNAFTHYLYETSSSSGQHDILSIWGDGNALWLGTNGAGLLKFNQENHALIKYEHPDHSIINYNIIQTILGTGTEELWVGTDGGFLYKFNMNTAEFEKVKVEYPRVCTLFIDNASDLWVGMRGGVNKIGKYHARFKQYSEDNEGNLISPHADLHAISVDSKGFVWVGSSADGLKKINRKTNEVKTYQYGAGNSLSSNGVKYMYIDAQDIAWIATNHGLNKFDIDTEEFTIYTPDANDEHSISSNQISTIYEDSQGLLWVATDQGVSIMNRATDKFRKIKHDPNNKNSLHSNIVEIVLEDKDGIFWIGFDSNGLDRYDPSSGSFQHFEHEDGNPESLSNNRVSHINEDSNGDIWIATYGGGLNKLNKESLTFTSYGTAHGIANTSLYCVLEDENNNLWVSHNEGISKFETNTKTFKNYFDGVEFNGNAYYQTREGEILLGTYCVVSFNPEEVFDNRIIPPVLVTDFKLYNEYVGINDESKIIDRPLEDTDSLTLAYNQNFFSFGYIALNYDRPENNRYKYKLENFDKEWVSANEITTANYTNVPPGEYIFRVIGSNNDLLWNEEGDSIYVKIVAPWWETLVFKIGVVLSALGLLWMLYMLRLSNIKKQKTDLENLVLVRTRELQENKEEIIQQNKQLIEINSEKNELIQIVSHDLRSPLNQIKGLASIVKMINPDLNEETRNSIDLIDDLVDRQRNMITKILDTNAIDANKINYQISQLCINQLIEEVHATFKVVADNKNIELKLNLAENDPCINADRTYLTKILENLLSNAIKFSEEETAISIITAYVDGLIEISVWDQGPGISESDMKLLFEKYTKLSAKPTGDEESTGLGLAIAKKYVEEMNGKIWCESELGHGAKFILQFNIAEQI